MVPLSSGWPQTTACPVRLLVESNMGELVALQLTAFATSVSTFPSCDGDSVESYRTEQNHMDNINKNLQGS